jgi:hypothetical protein
MDFNFKHFGLVDVSKLESLILNSNLDWDYYTFRQTHRKGQQETKTIPLIWGENFNEVYEREFYSIFENELNKIGVILNDMVGEGKISTALLINLPKKKSILPHTDSGDGHFFRTNRLHIPIQTNKSCLFTVSDETIHMQKGHVWEINNSTKTHSVVNNGESDRIHLLIDYEQKNKNLL